MEWLLQFSQISPYLLVCTIMKVIGTAPIEDSTGVRDNLQAVTTPPPPPPLFGFIRSAC